MVGRNDRQDKRGQVFRRIAAAAGFAVLLMPAAVLAAPAVELAKTGQVSCWDGDGKEISCSETGQDGQYRAGVAWPEPRFTDNGNGTISDRLTDLVWLKNADCFGVIGWQQALDHAGSLASGACGLADGSTAGTWRLPNRKELLSIVSFQQANGAAWLAGQGFTGGIHGWYWSSDSYAPNPAVKWAVHSVGAAWADNNPLIDPREFHAMYVRDPGVPVLAVTPLQAAFGDVQVGTTSGPVPLTLQNSGTATLSLASVTLGGADAGMFSLDPGSGLAGTCGTLTPTLAAGRSCSVAVTFTPSAAGARNAILSLLPQGGTAMSVPLTGAGYEPVYRVSASTADDKGTVSPAASFVSKGEAATISVSPSPGYQAATSVAGTCPAGSFAGTTYTTGAITADCTAIISFVPRTFTISTVADGHGSIGCLPGMSALFQTAVSCTVTPEAGYEITAVTVDGTSLPVADPAAYTHPFGPLTENHTMVASFGVVRIPTFTVTSRAAEHGTVTPSDPQTAPAGSTITLTVAPVAGYHLASIAGCGGTLDEDRFTTAPLSGDCLVTATFEPDTLADTIKAFRSLLGLTTLTPAERHRYDVAPLGAGGVPEPDGVIGVGDIVVMLRRLTGLIDW